MDEIVCVDLPASGSKVSEELQLVEINLDVLNTVSGTVSGEVVGQVTASQVSNISKECDNEDTVGLIDVVDNTMIEPCDKIIGDLSFPGPKLVSEEQIPQSLVCTELQLENQSDLQIRVSTAKSVDTVLSVQPDIGAQETDNCENLHPVSVGVSFTCNEFPTFKVLHQSHDLGSRSLSFEAGETDPFQTRENLELHNSDRASRVEDFSNQAGLDAGQLYGPSHLRVPSTHQVTPFSSISSEPLQDELERIHEATEQLKKHHEDVILQLKCECEKRINEIVSQIRHEHEVKIKDAEAALTLKKNELKKNETIVLMNKMLAEAFKSKFLDLKLSELLGMQQGISPSLMQQLPSVPSLQSATIAVETRQSLQTPSSPQSVRPFPVAGQRITKPVRHASPSSGTLSRPPVISVITPSRNPRAGGEIRTTAPHLQPFRPVGPSSTPRHVTPMKPQNPLTNTQTMPLSLQPSILQQPSTVLSQSISDPSNLSSSQQLPLSSLELTIDLNSLPPVNLSSPPVDPGLALDSAHLETLTEAHISSAVEAHVVCLSDDE